MTKRIILPLLSKTPHLTSSSAPNACEVKVSCAQLIPIIRLSPQTLINVVARPTPAVIAGFPSRVTRRFRLEQETTSSDPEFFPIISTAFPFPAFTPRTSDVEMGGVATDKEDVDLPRRRNPMNLGLFGSSLWMNGSLVLDLCLCGFTLFVVTSKSSK